MTLFANKFPAVLQNTVTAKAGFGQGETCESVKNLFQHLKK